MSGRPIRWAIAIVVGAVLIASLAVSAGPPEGKPDNAAKAEARAERNAEQQARAEARTEARTAKKAQKAEQQAARAERKQAKAKPEKITLCHKPDTPDGVTITVAEPAVEAHLAHGDYLGECSDVPPGWCKPTVEIIAPAVHPWAQALLLQSTIECEDSSLPVPDLTLLWEVEGLTPDPDTVNTHHLHIPAKELTIGENVATFTVSYGPPVGGSTTVSQAFEVVHSPLVALIEGGSRSVYVGAPHTLDASASYDPDAPLGGVLAFEWTLTDAAGAPVPGAPVLEDRPVLEFETLDWLEPGRDYLVTVTVTDELTDREASRRITLTTLDAVALDVTIVTSTTTINPDQRLKLQGLVGGLTSNLATYVWTEESGKFSPEQLRDTSIIASRPGIPLLIIRENILTPGETYMFRLSVTDTQSGGVGSGVITITVNVPPSP